MARKKVIFVIVEGPSDETALGVILNRIYDRNKVHIEIVHGDITSDLNYNPNNIVGGLGNIVKKYAETTPLSKTDFQEVIHLVDMDGAFIPDSAIVENSRETDPYYSLTAIQTSNPKNLSQRNKHKKSNLNCISKLKKVWGTIPYHVYYMSCNLDHVLYGKLNSSNDNKESDSLAFAKRYKDDIDGFLTFISDSEFSRMEGYKESWEFIKKDLHSLERHTNLCLCFTEIRKARKQNTQDT